jgi:hypothetical protein
MIKFPVIGSIRTFMDVKSSLDNIRNWFTNVFFGDVTGPSSAKDSDIVEFAGTTGKYFKDGRLTHDMVIEGIGKSHNRLHSINSTLDHSSVIPSGHLLRSSSDGLFESAGEGYVSGESGNLLSTTESVHITIGGNVLKLAVLK